MKEQLKKYAYEQINNYLEKNNFDVMVVTSCENCYYLTGVSLYYNAVIVKKNEEPILLVKYIDLQLAKNMSYVKDIRGYSPYPIDFRDDVLIGDYATSIANVIKDIGCDNKRICIADYWAVLRPYLGLLENLPDADIVVGEAFLEKIRCVKQKEEKELIQKSVDLLDNALYDCASLFREGVAEADVVGAIAKSIWNNSGELSHVIIASGVNSLLPHSKITKHKFVNGESVVVDLVSNYEGYFSGLTRTFVIGEPNEEQRKIYNVLLKTAEKVYTTVRPGMPIKKIAQLAIESFAEYGYEKNVRHAFGHAIGVFQHEMPILNTSEERLLEVGMIFCFEPGIYLDNVGGFRLGDLVIMTEHGLEKMCVHHRKLNPEIRE